MSPFSNRNGADDTSFSKEVNSFTARMRYATEVIRGISVWFASLFGF